MKAKSIRYERLKSTGNYEHEKVSIELEIGEGEKAEDVLRKAKVFVNTSLINRQHEKEISLSVVADENSSVKETKKANEMLATIEEYDGLPF